MLFWCGLAERGRLRNFAFRGSLGSAANSTTLHFYLGFATGQMWGFFSLEFHFCFSHDASVQTAFPQLRTRSCSSLQLRKHALNTGHSLHPEKAVISTCSYLQRRVELQRRNDESALLHFNLGVFCCVSVNTLSLGISSICHSYS